jgi:hypothetical protein
MRIIGCDLHARQQTLAMLDTTTGEVVEVTLKHEGDNVREFYSSLPRPDRRAFKHKKRRPSKCCSSANSFSIRGKITPAIFSSASAEGFSRV